MNERIKKELEILAKEFPGIKYKDDWIFILNYKLPPNIWNRNQTSICFQIPVSYPGEPPYGFCVPIGIRIKSGEGEKAPSNYTEPSPTIFEGEWGKFSWIHDNSWRATSDINTGGNLLNFVRSFADRFKENI